MAGNSVLLIVGAIYAAFGFSSSIKKYKDPKRSDDRFSGLVGIIFWGLALFFMFPHLLNL
jgi:hypothetical protein